MAIIPGPADILAGAQFLDRIRESFPFYEEETTVAVYGNSNSKMADLFNQAIALAFGQTSNVFLPKTVTPFVADAQFDEMHKSVTVLLRYIQAGVASQFPGSPALGIFNNRFFNDPPPDNVKVGQPNNAWFNGDVNSAALKAVMDNNKPVAVGDPGTIATPGALTGRANWIPGTAAGGVPSINSGNRGTFLENLVYSALATDCQSQDAWSPLRGNPVFAQPPRVPTTTPTGTSVSSQYSITGLTSDLYSSLSNQPSGDIQDPQSMLSTMVNLLQNVNNSG